MLCFQGQDNGLDDASINEQVDPVEYLDVNSTCCDEENNDSASYDEESHDTAAAESAPIDKAIPVRRKRKAEENMANSEKRMDEAFALLKQVANKPKSAKDEISLFCELLCLKLRALDDDTREIAMHEINNLMFNIKKKKKDTANLNDTTTNK